MHIRALFAAVVLALASASASATPKPRPVTAAVLAGSWTSDGCESAPDGNGGTMHFTRTFTFTRTTWSIDFSTYGDAACSDAAKLLTATIGGPYRLAAPSKTVDGATEARFLFAHRTVTPKSEGVLGWLDGQKVCGRDGWKVGEAADVDASGCPQLGAYPKSVCQGEYDVVEVTGDRLQFGARPADGNLCSEDRRPKALGAALVRVAK